MVPFESLKFGQVFKEHFEASRVGTKIKEIKITKGRGSESFDILYNDGTLSSSYPGLQVIPQKVTYDHDLLKLKELKKKERFYIAGNKGNIYTVMGNGTGDFDGNVYVVDNDLNVDKFSEEMYVQRVD